MPTFSLAPAPARLVATPSTLVQCSPTDPAPEGVESHSFGIQLMPANFRRRVARLVSYYALFKGMAASKPTS